MSDGSTGKAERIQRWRCQACQTCFSARLHTPLYRLKTPSHQVALVLSALAEGLDVSAAERVFGVRQATTTRWLLRAGAHAQTLHQRTFCQLEIPHVQLDELRTDTLLKIVESRNRCLGWGGSLQGDLIA